MGGNAHRTRPRNKICSTDCKFCKHRAKEGKRLRLFKNKTGHRHNPAANKKQKR